MLVRIRAAMDQGDKTHQLNGTIKYDGTYFGSQLLERNGAEARKKRRFSQLYPWMNWGISRYAKMQVTQNIKQASVKKFVQAAFVKGSTIHSDGYRYIPALEGYTYEHKPYPIWGCSTGCTS